MPLYNVFQQLNGRQWLWLVEAYWRLWPILLRIKFRQKSWLATQFSLQDRTSVGAQYHNDMALRMYESVKLAARLHFLLAECLPRSIVLKQMLCARKLDAKLVVGVAIYDKDLASHAWVEVSGVMVGEPEAVAKDFMPIEMPIK